ncbi:type IV pilin protein [Salinispirillum sp. LH 10-3-1]|uniref:type IV pilin protein n=1 Tax=Salinispirillum sp. LH 10-3-1 TaxID=2952525 RepID=UPI00272A1DC0
MSSQFSGGFASRMRGVNLIELMIVVAVIAVLAAIAIPNYQRYQQDARRADAQAVLVDFTQRLERNFSVNNSYLRPGGVVQDLPAAITGYTFQYSAAPNAPTATSYRVEARPVNVQANDRCGVLLVDNRGNRTAQVLNADNSLGAVINDCWR